MATDLIRYDLLVQDALRSVVRKVLADTARSGLVGDHHFNIAFKTHAPGVILPAAVRQRFPDEMSIILQHEFWDLAVTQDAFEVSLNFSRKAERLTVPFDSITGFTDPSVPFGFKLEPRVSETASRAPARRGGKADASGPPSGQARGSEALRPGRLRSEVRPGRGKAGRTRRRNEGRVDRRVPQEIAGGGCSWLKSSICVAPERRRNADAKKRRRRRTAPSLAVRRPRSVSSRASARAPRRASTPAAWRSPMATDGASARVVKRSLVIAGHRTSVSLEDAFWRRLRGSRPSAASPSIALRRQSTHRAAAPTCRRPSGCSCSRPKARGRAARRETAPPVSRACQAPGRLVSGAPWASAEGAAPEPGPLAPSWSLLGGRERTGPWPGARPRRPSAASAPSAASFSFSAF